MNLPVFEIMRFNGIQSHKLTHAIPIPLVVTQCVPATTRVIFRDVARTSFDWALPSLAWLIVDSLALNLGF